jgi:hypothetical protein
MNVRRVWHVEYMGDNRYVWDFFVVNRGRETWKHVGSDIKIYVEQIRWKGMGWIYFSFVHGTETSHFVKCVEFLTIWGTISLSMTLIRGVSPLIQSNLKFSIKCQSTYN